MKKIVCLFVCLFAVSANATVLDLSSLSHGNLGVSSVVLPDAKITNLSGGTLYVGAAGINNEICGLSSSWNCQQDVEIDFNNLVSDLSFVVSGWQPGDSVLASIFGASNNFLSSLTIANNGLFDFGTISGISKLVFDDSSTSAGVAYDHITFNKSSSVPEPAPLLLLALGLIGLGVSRKMKNA